MDTEDTPKSWNYKNIVFSIVFLGILVGVAYWQREYLLGFNSKPKKEVAGVETGRQNNQGKVAAPQIDLQKKIADITEQISQLDVQEVAGSSPQVQKVLKDMESLKDLPKNEAKNACMSICNSL